LRTIPEEVGGARGAWLVRTVVIENHPGRGWGGTRCLVSENRGY